MSSKINIINKKFNCANILKHAFRVENATLDISDVAATTILRISIGGQYFFAKMSFAVRSSNEIFSSGPKDVPTTPVHRVESQIITELNRVLLETRCTSGIFAIITHDLCKDAKLHLQKMQNFYQAQDLKSQIGKYLFNNEFSFMITEYLNFTLESYIHDYSTRTSVLGREVFRSFMFQILHTLHMINSVFPQFTHHDLHEANIMIKVDKNYDPSTQKFLLYIDAKGGKYYVPYFGMIAKIIDFGYSELPERELISEIRIMPKVQHREITNDINYLMYNVDATLGQLEDSCPFRGILRQIDNSCKYREVASVRAKKDYLHKLQSDAFAVYRKYAPREEDIIFEYGGPRAISRAKGITRMTANAEVYSQRANKYIDDLLK